MIVRFLAALFLLGLVPNEMVHAQEKKTVLNRCYLPTKNTQIRIKTIEQGFRVHSNLSSTTLNLKGNVSFAGDYVIGITFAAAKTIIDYDGEIWQDKKTGGECFTPQISIKIIYEPFDIYVGSEFAPNTCTYNAILEHEMQHVRLYQENLPLLESNLRSLLEKRFAGKPIYAPEGETKKLIGTEIDELWRPLIKSELAKVQIEQNRIDSEDELNRLSWVCLAEVQNIFGTRFH